MYTDGGTTFNTDGQSVPNVRGTRACRDNALGRMERNQKPAAIEVNAEDSASFFYRRSTQARDAVRDSLKTASTDQIVALSATLKIIEKATEDFRVLAELPNSYSPAPPRLVPVRVSQFHNRAKEKESISRFVEAVNGKRLMVIHGQPGIGKKELLAEVQRLSANRDRWIRFRCSPKSRLNETFAQWLVRLGLTTGGIPSIDEQLFTTIVDTIASQGSTIAVLEEVHHLPLSDGEPDHTDFLSFLAYLCSERYDGRVRFILVSDWRGHLQFSRSHQMETLRVEGLEREYVVEMLQEHLASHASRYVSPTVDELSSIASRVHGHPYMTKIASVVLESTPASEVIEKLYARIETRQFVVGRLLGRITLSVQEQLFLEFAWILRMPVLPEAFGALGGSTSHALLEELLDRFLLVAEDNRVRLHPVLAEFFSMGLNDANHVRRLHEQAFAYFEKIRKRRQLTVDERIEFIYHGVTCGKSMDLRDMQAFVGSVRSALTEGVRTRDWTMVESSASQLISVWPFESIGQIGLALAMEATGRELEASKYLGCLDHVSTDNLWLAIEFVKNRIRRRDFEGAERALATISRDSSLISTRNEVIASRFGLER